MATTVGFDFYADKKCIQGIDITVYLYDTGGQDKFRAMGANYFRDADGIFLIFSFADQDSSIRGLELWI